MQEGQVITTIRGVITRIDGEVHRHVRSRNGARRIRMPNARITIAVEPTDEQIEKLGEDYEPDPYEFDVEPKVVEKLHIGQEVAVEIRMLKP